VEVIAKLLVVPYMQQFILMRFDHMSHSVVQTIDLLQHHSP
jgi:hypothetical protein